MQKSPGDLGEGVTWAQRDTGLDAVFDRMRESGGPYFVSRTDGSNTKGDYWSLTRHADICDVSRRPADFSSAGGTTIEDATPQFLDTASFIAMDDPRHTRLRRIVSRGFAPGALNQLVAEVESIASGVVDDVAAKESCDFVDDVAAIVPARVICHLMGIPQTEESSVIYYANRLLSPYDPEHIADQSDAGRLAARLDAIEQLSGLARDLAADRQKNPRDDLVTILVNKGTNDETLTDREMADFFILLLAAGLETTRNAIAHGMLALSRHADQRDLWQSNFDDYAHSGVDEILRWATPVLHMRRTVTRDGVKVGEQVMSEGDKVVMWYYAGNRDPEVFDLPQAFDIKRSPNEHISFGAHGVHYCLGAHLARREIMVTFKHTFRRLKEVEVTGPPEWLSSSFLNGIKHLPISYTPVDS